ncbi:MAG: bifunctional folylpolyglutamate synthase/dihydrofolate synthase [Planctomycetota bacterium]
MESSLGTSAARSRLDALIDWERRDRAAGMRVDTAPVRDLLERLGSPQTGFDPIHLAGSKGKGSVAAWIDLGLRRAGLRTGRYGSPHLEALEERACLDGRPCEPQVLDRSLEATLAALEAARAERTPGCDATWFDVLTASAFDLFARSGAQRQVVECGLGGRLDSTNVLRAPVVVLTTIELEHTAVLGSTREAIAREKAGVVWPGASVVVGLPEPGTGDPAADAVEVRVREVGARARYLPPLAGDGIAERNRRLAAAALQAAGERGQAGADGRPLGADLLDGVDPAEAQLPGRLERLEVPDRAGAPVQVVLDGAHTVDSVALVRAALEGDGDPPAVLIVALGRDKDPSRVLKPLLGWVDNLRCTATDPARHHPPEALSVAATALGFAAEASPSPEAALESVLGSARPGRILILGSLLLVGRLRSACLRRSTTGPRC